MFALKANYLQRALGLLSFIKSKLHFYSALPPLLYTPSIRIALIQLPSVSFTRESETRMEGIVPRLLKGGEAVHSLFQIGHWGGGMSMLSRRLPAHSLVLDAIGKEDSGHLWRDTTGDREKEME